MNKLCSMDSYYWVRYLYKSERVQCLHFSYNTPNDQNEYTTSPKMWIQEQKIEGEYNKQANKLHTVTPLANWRMHTSISTLQPTIQYS